MLTWKCTWFSAKPNSPNSKPKRSRSRNAWVQVSMWLCFRKFRYLLCVGNIMVTQLLRASSIIFLGATLFTFSISIISPVASLKGRRKPAARDKKEIWFDWKKKRCSFSSAGLPLCSRPRSILSRNYKKRKKEIEVLFSPVFVYV